MASMVGDGGTWTWLFPESSRQVPDTPGIHALAGSARTSVPSLPLPEWSRTTVLPGPSSSHHHPTRSRISGFGVSPTPGTCGAPPATANANTSARLETRTQADMREHRRAVEAPGLHSRDADDD